MQSIGYSLFAIFFGGITLLSLNSPKTSVLSWLLSFPLLAVFGFYSYAIYVFHFPLIQVFDRWFPVHKLSSVLHSGPLGVGVHVICSILVSLLIGVLSWNLYEKHFFLSLRNISYFPHREERGLQTVLGIRLNPHWSRPVCFRDSGNSVFGLTSALFRTIFGGGR